ncbi:protein TAP1-like [Salvia miltiorrhiza]|uniref:protein TAP1-like n=1 Tax=Salvia miltiorrhiza TaxID=226208 RepID=UPI0025AD509D|nr:protein TAP1-like [Salvia miltiorrhiza]
MGRKGIQTIVGLMMVVMALLNVGPTMAHLPPGACIDRCLKECKSSGIGVAACIKYCPVHCLPPDTSTKQHYCSLGCMLDQCAKFTSDEKRMTDCVFKCRKFHCKINAKIVE